MPSARPSGVPTYSREDYLEAIFVLARENGAVRSSQVVAYLGVSKPSVSRMVHLLIESGHLEMEPSFELRLTEAGTAVAEKIYTRHCFFKKQLIDAGVDPSQAELEACRMEHVISEDSFIKLCQAAEQN